MFTSQQSSWVVVVVVVVCVFVSVCVLVYKELPSGILLNHFSLFVCVCVCFETGSHYAALAGLELAR